MAEAGLGCPDFQGDNAIAVREPSVDWHGREALFKNGRPEPQNPPEALRTLVRVWKANR